MHVIGALTGSFIRVKITLKFEPGSSTWQAEVLAKLYYERGNQPEALLLLKNNND